MTLDALAEFPAIGSVAAIVDQLDTHRQRQVFAFIAERYGWNLQPSPKKITATPSKNNTSEFPAIEQAAELLDDLSPDQQRQAVALLGARYNWKIGAAYKPPSKGFAPKRKFAKG